MLKLHRPNFDRIKLLLQRRQKEVETDLKAMEADDPVMNSGLAESSEPGTDSWMADVHTRSIAARQNLVSLLSSTKAALLRLKTGKFGICENCGKPIEPARLEAMPTATLCVACAKKLAKKS